jgi:Uma2 family endonuclease
MPRPLASPIALRLDPVTGLDCCPSLEDAARLPPATLEAIHAWLDEQLAAHLETQPPEGTAHSGTISELQDRLKGHFQRVGRGVFIASNLGVHYPESPVFAPDLLAVVDVPLHDRARWRVDVEGRGLDFVLEVVVDGDRHKDTERNVARYAGLGIPEYMVCLVREQTLLGWRLESPGTGRYTRIVPQYGRLPSRVLGLEFGVAGGRLRCWRDGAELPLTAEIVALLGRLVDEKEAANAELRARAAEEAERAEAEAARAAAEAARARAEAARARAALRRSILRTLRLRGVDVPDHARAAIEACENTETLEHWDERAATVTALEALFEV